MEDKRKHLHPHPPSSNPHTKGIYVMNWIQQKKIDHHFFKS